PNGRGDSAPSTGPLATDRLEAGPAQQHHRPRRGERMARQHPFGRGRADPGRSQDRPGRPVHGQRAPGARPVRRGPRVAGPLAAAGARADRGQRRGAAWAPVVGRLSRGLALAVDYSHSRAPRPAYGTLTGYRGGSPVPAVPDGSCDVTAHVALDACTVAGQRAGATSGLLTTQRDALRALGLTGTRPPLEIGRASWRERGAVAVVAQ